MTEKNVMVSARLPQSLVEEIDRRRKLTSLTRTEWLTRAVTHVLADTRKVDPARPVAESAHAFVPQKGSPQRCETCGQRQAVHPRDA
jgi:metal-responsive CopG/Arc/MetJ family transcriptional regulator